MIGLDKSEIENQITIRITTALLQDPKDMNRFAEAIAEVVADVIVENNKRMLKQLQEARVKIV